METGFAPSCSSRDSGACGKNASWTLHEDGTAAISGIGDMGFYVRLTSEE